MKEKEFVPNPPPPKGHRLNTRDLFLSPEQKKDMQNYIGKPIKGRRKKIIGAHIVIVFANGLLLMIKGFTDPKDADKLQEESLKGMRIMAERYLENGWIPPHIHVVRCMLEINGNMVLYKGTEDFKSCDIIAPCYYGDDVKRTTIYNPDGSVTIKEGKHKRHIWEHKVK
jgi:hypothetical protein